MSRILFGIIAALILIAIAYFTVKMYSVGFRFNGINTKLTFFTFLLIPFIFFASILTTRSLSLGIGPWLYTAIQILAELAFYIALGAIVLGIMFLTGMLTHTSIPMSVSFAVLILSFTLGIVGLIQSRIITTTHYTVTLTGAPASWNDKRAVLVTDTHFGLVNYKKFSEKVVDAILTIKPDVVFHAGDFYDGLMIKTAPITTSWKRLSNTQPVFLHPAITKCMATTMNLSRLSMTQE